MLQTLLWFLALGLSAVPLWILWRASKKATSLDFRIMQNDASLLEEDGITIHQMTGLPLNSQITPNANVIVVPAQANGARDEE